MNILEFERLVKTEDRARRFLLGRCRRAAPMRCPACREKRIYIISGGRLRKCSCCGRSFNPFAGRWINRVRLSSSQWLWIVKLFELESPATVITAEIDASYPTVLKAIDTIRSAISNVASPFRDANGSPSGAESNFLCVTDATPGVRPLAAELINLWMHIGDRLLVMARCSFPCRALEYGNRTVPLVDAGKTYPNRRVFCDEPGFWSFAKQRLLRYHGISPAKMPLYLQEMDFRWRHRNGDLFGSVLALICGFAPEGSSA